MGGRLGAGLCSKWGNTARRMEGPPWTVTWFVPCTEHVKKDIKGAETHSLLPGLGLWALPIQRHLFLIPIKAPYGSTVAPRSGSVSDLGLNPISSGPRALAFP